MTLRRPLAVLIVCFATVPVIAQDTATEPQVDFATYLSGNKQTTVWASALDRSGNLYVTGTTSAGDYPTTPGHFYVLRDKSASTVLAVSRQLLLRR